MLIYYFHPTTGVFLGSGQADPDPAELDLARLVAVEPILAALSALDPADVTPEAVEEARAAASAVADAVEPTIWLVPANATLEEPPSFGFNDLVIWTPGEGWSVKPAPAAEPAPEPELPSESQLAANVRAERVRRINAVRPLVDRHRDEQALGLTTTLTGEDYMAVLAYIQALRDVTEQNGFPTTVEWPVLAPELLALGD